MILGKLLLTTLIASALIIPGFQFLTTTWQRYNPISGAWHQQTITYYNHSEYRTTLKTAIERWEATGLEIDFRPVDSPEQADLQIFSSASEVQSRCQEKRCLGWATIGYTPFRRAEIWLQPSNNNDESWANDQEMLPTMIHELGHVLGLKHSQESCAIMNSDSICQAPGAEIFNQGQRKMPCGPHPADLQQLQKLYPEAQERPERYCYDRRQPAQT